MVRARAWGVVLCLLGSLWTTPAGARGTRHVALGEVNVVPASRANMAPLLRSTLEHELGALDLHGAKKDAILSVSLVKLDSVPASGGAEVTCVVSATLRGPRSGSIFAILEGRARVEGPGVATKVAVESAVHGALVRVPEALK